MTNSFAHAWVHSCFSFLRGEAWPETLVALAAELGYTALALTDWMSVSGAVRFQRKAMSLGIHAAVGADLSLEDGNRFVALAETAEGYRSLCRLLTESHLGSPRKDPRVTWKQLEAVEGMIFLVGGREGRFGEALLRRDEASARGILTSLLERVPVEKIRLFITRDGMPGNRLLEEGILFLANTYGIRPMAAHPVWHARKDGFWVHDLLTCLRLGIPLEALHRERPLNAERYLKSPQEMGELFRDHPEWLREAGEVVARCRSPFDFGARLYPRWAGGAAEAAAILRREVYEGARRHYGRLSPRLVDRIEHELRIITELGFADYFCLVADIVRFARERGFRVTGRGSAADSVVAYCLGITTVDAFRRGHLFERFLNRERAEQPDIDLDIDYRYRDQVADYVYARYGREHTAAVCTFQTFRARSAIRALGRVLELPAEEIERLAKRMPWGLPADAIAGAWKKLPELRGLSEERWRLLVQAAGRIAGLPRHIGTHLGGIVVARLPLDQVAPRQRSAKGVEILALDKEDVEDLGLLKLDLLSLRTLAVLEDVAPTVDRCPDADERTYRRIGRGETIGVFQLESPAQRALQPQLRPRRLEDLVHAVALIRPGPIQGDMVGPYLRRRLGEEKVTYLHPELEPILAKTYGVVLFQEQVIEVARVVAGFQAGEADRLRRVMTHARSHGQMAAIGRLFVRRAMARGVRQETAKAIFRMLAGYASYGFSEAHAAAFAELAYATAFWAEHDPAAYFAALLSHQPMGYYPMHTLVAEARHRGVAILPPDVTTSDVACRREGRAIRLGLGLIAGVGRSAEEIVRERGRRSFCSLADFRERVRLPRDVYAALCLAGALDGFGANRRQMLLEAERGEGLFGWREVTDFPEPTRSWLRESVLPIEGPTIFFRPLRPWLMAKGFSTTRQVRDQPRGKAIRVAGLPLRPHRPPTRSGRTVVFFSLEDEYGLVDAVMFEDVYQRHGQDLFQERLLPLAVEGRVERRRGTLSLVVERLWPIRLRSLDEVLPPRGI